MCSEDATGLPAHPILVPNQPLLCSAPLRLIFPSMPKLERERSLFAQSLPVQLSTDTYSFNSLIFEKLIHVHNIVFKTSQKVHNETTFHCVPKPHPAPQRQAATTILALFPESVCPRISLFVLCFLLFSTNGEVYAHFLPLAFFT